MRASSRPAPMCCPDLAWLPPQIVCLAVTQFVAIGAGGLVLLFLHWPWEGPELLALGLVHALVNFAGACSCWRTTRVRWAFQLVVLVVFCTDAVMLNYMSGYAELGPMARGSVMGTMDALVKLLAGSVMPMPIYLPFLLFTNANAIVSSHVVGAWHDQPVEPTQYALIITTSIIALIHARAMQFWPAALQDVSGQLSREGDPVPERARRPREVEPKPADSEGSPPSPSAVAAPPRGGSGFSASASSAAAPQPPAPVRLGAPAGPPARQAPAPAGRAARPCPALPSARLRELRELAVEFDALSPQFTVRSCTLHFAHEAAGLQLPLLMDFLQAPNAAAFKTWAQEQANTAFAAEEGAEETTLPVPGSCQVVFSVPTLGMKLVGESAELHIAPDEELEEPEVLATLRMRDLSQLQQRRHRTTRPRSSNSNSRLRTIDESRAHSGTTPDVSLEQRR